MKKILKFNSPTAIIEILDSSFPIGKVQINFMKINKVTNAQEAKIMYYVNISKFKSLLTSIDSGDFMNRYYNGQKELFKDTGGSNGQARMFTITKGDRVPLILQCVSGKGKIDEKNGGITLESVTTRVSMGFTFEQLFSLSLVDTFLQSYVACGYLNQTQLWNNTYQSAIIYSSLSGNNLDYEIGWLEYLDIQKTKNFNNSFKLIYNYRSNNENLSREFWVRDIPRDMLANIRSRKDKIQLEYNENKL